MYTQIKLKSVLIFNILHRPCYIQGKKEVKFILRLLQRCVLENKIYFPKHIFAVFLQLRNLNPYQNNTTLLKNL